MVDSIQYKQQNQQMQLQGEFQMPYIRCQIHQNSQAECINLNADSNNVLFCLKCAVSNGWNLNGNKLVIIEEIFCKNSESIIKNWPPLEDQRLYDFLNRNDIQKEKRSENISKINSKFDDLKRDIIKIIDDQQKKIIEHMNMIEDNRQKILKVYNQISQRQEIKKQIWNKQKNLEELVEYLQELIKEKQKQSSSNQQVLKDCIDNFRKCEQSLSFDWIDYLSSQIQKYVKSIDFLNGLEENQFGKQLNQNEQQNVVGEIKKEMQKQDEKESEKQIEQQNVVEIKKEMSKQAEKEQPKQIEVKQDLIELKSYENVRNQNNYYKIDINLWQEDLIIWIFYQIYHINTFIYNQILITFTHKYLGANKLEMEEFQIYHKD